MYILPLKIEFASSVHFQIIVKQEITRKVGVGMTPEEEILRSKLENMQVLVSAPTQFKGRLSELLSQMRMQRNQWHHAVGNGYTLDKGKCLLILMLKYFDKIPILTFQIHPRK